MNYRQIAEQIFLAGVESVLPKNLIAGRMSLEGNVLRFAGLDLSIPKGNLYVIGAGKASALMGAEVENILGNRITGGHIVVKYGCSCKLRHIIVTEAGHPVPDSNGFLAAKEILKVAVSAGTDDIVICLISGGGSSLLSDTPEGCYEEDMIVLNNLLVNSGASIIEINAVRKHLSQIKGGQLARAVFPATLINLILSDVPGDALEVIASGPTVPDSTTFLQATTVLSEYGLKEKVPERILKYLANGVKGIRTETPKPGDPIFAKTYNILAGSNKTALEACRTKALDLNINAVIIDDQLQGDTATVADYIVATALKFKNDTVEVKPVCLLFGGETTVRMTGKGTGGRNQHLALLASLQLRDLPGITVLAAGTDGNDGPTDAAGAVVDSTTVEEALRNGLDAEKYLSDFDSYHLFKKAGGHIKTGPTMTNVMDLIVVLVE